MKPGFGMSIRFISVFQVKHDTCSMVLGSTVSAHHFWMSNPNVWWWTYQDWPRNTGDLTGFPPFFTRGPASRCLHRPTFVAAVTCLGTGEIAVLCCRDPDTRSHGECPGERFQLVRPSLRSGQSLENIEGGRKYCFRTRKMILSHQDRSSPMTLLGYRHHWYRKNPSPSDKP